MGGQNTGKERNRLQKGEDADHKIKRSSKKSGLPFAGQRKQSPCASEKKRVVTDWVVGQEVNISRKKEDEKGREGGRMSWTSKCKIKVRAMNDACIVNKEK